MIQEVTDQRSNNQAEKSQERLRSLFCVDSV